jgi:hypothetical protein
MRMEFESLTMPVVDALTDTRWDMHHRLQEQFDEDSRRESGVQATCDWVALQRDPLSSFHPTQSHTGSRPCVRHSRRAFGRRTRWGGRDRYIVLNHFRSGAFPHRRNLFNPQ